jgi:hypothetical protein
MQHKNLLPMTLLLEAQYRCHERHSFFLTAKLACTVTASARAALSDMLMKFHSAAQLSETHSVKGKRPYWLTSCLTDQL